ncbi:isocitrate lyase/PEP mutase family protein [Ruicaihuangia caeni]|uniref:Isocitrate lyase/PEP mutase family protein n=1 Tax=Ruicaihuangia caeni TaxID=3042517 RepID=A0AAW6T2A3_9MICO|nr:isocitrate lyase/PEP mutase family protein [Klugiella sp. YN-L-19]MDI2097449.1 isocitrate lyase/PEP mutase family protein [Klugiella sp. YN-L-19]
MTPAQRLRELIATGEPIAAPGAAEPLTARLVEQAGFPAVYMTGFGATAIRLGTPDIGLLTQTEMSDHARNMTRAVGIPVIADADNGYGGPSNIERTVHEYIQAGVAALHLEDQSSPKRCGHMAGIRLLDSGSSVRRIAAAVEARGSDELVIIARTDALGVSGMLDAIERASMYRDSGADMVFIDGVKRIAEVEEIAKRVEGPKVLPIVAGAETERLTLDDARELGFSIVLYALDALFAATKAAAETLAAMRQAGRSVRDERALGYEEFQRMVGIEHHQDLDHRFGG